MNTALQSTTVLFLLKSGTVIAVGFSCPPDRLRQVIHEVINLARHAENEISRSAELSAAIPRIPNPWNEVIDVAIEQGLPVELIGEADASSVDLHRQLVSGSDLFVDSTGALSETAPSAVS